MNETDADRLELLDRIAARIPDLDLDRQQVEWTTLDDGHEALLVNGGGLDGGAGAYFVNCRRGRARGRVAGPDRRRLHRLHRDPAGWQPLRRPRGARPVGAAQAGLAPGDVKARQARGWRI